MKNFFSTVLFLGAILIGVVSCKKDKHDHEHHGNLKLKFEQVFGMSGDEFKLNSLFVHPMTSDSLTFTTFKFYISNVKLKKSDGAWFTVPESYYLIDQSNAASQEITIADIPEGSYTEVSLMIGVDSARNVSGAQTGALDPAKGMFWNWNTGYIMIMAEGTSPQATDGVFEYHLGGFSGANKAIAERNFVLSEAVKIEEDKNPKIVIRTNPARLWHSVGSVSTGNKVHMPGEKAGTMAQDFNSWIRVDHIHN